MPSWQSEENSVFQPIGHTFDIDQHGLNFVGNNMFSSLLHCRPQDTSKNQIQIKKNLIFAKKISLRLWFYRE